MLGFREEQFNNLGTPDEAQEVASQRLFDDVVGAVQNLEQSAQVREMLTELQSVDSPEADASKTAVSDGAEIITMMPPDPDIDVIRRYIEAA